MNQVTLVAKNKADCLERILQRTRLRGFKVEEFTMQVVSNESLSITMLVKGSRPLCYLTKQLDKLHDISEVRSQSPSSEGQSYARTA